jgi:hypothetical protein
MYFKNWRIYAKTRINILAKNPANHLTGLIKFCLYLI